MSFIKKILILGSGELGKEVTIAAKRYGQYVIAVDSYARAPAMQVADEFEVISMLNGDDLERIIKKHKPDIIVPEIEAIRTEKLKEFEDQGIFVVPTAEAAHLTMNRDAIRQVAKEELGLKTANYAYAESLNELQNTTKEIGFPCVIKPVMSSSGKGQSIAKSFEELENSWDIACSSGRGDKIKVIVEEFIDFDFEITLLTVKQKKGPTIFVKPIGHRQERGDYQESWLPAEMSSSQLEKAKEMAKKITDRLGGSGIFGVEFFVKGSEVYFSELSPRPHDTGMVTIISQNLSEFELHMRAILGLPIPEIEYYGPSASSVILADRDSTECPNYSGLEEALERPGTEIRIFGKPSTRKYRRMGVALAKAASTEEARKLSKESANSIIIKYL
ncbi:MAG: formate-dependent phosphoribosylglycinamide formyltransferase [Bdellovibrionaceae bacterium]|nr:formate-dependent phosphoribosylglycinamide formyltransferase [Pseudobdellovibrionaceae bacterium]